MMRIAQAVSSWSTWGVRRGMMKARIGAGSDEDLRASTPAVITDDKSSPAAGPGSGVAGRDDSDNDDDEDDDGGCHEDPRQAEDAGR
jgi:hypothetical protein